MRTTILYGLNQYLSIPLADQLIQQQQTSNVFVLEPDVNLCQRHARALNQYQTILAQTPHSPEYFQNSEWVSQASHLNDLQLDAYLYLSNAELEFVLNDVRALNNGTNIDFLDKLISELKKCDARTVLIYDAANDVISDNGGPSHFEHTLSNLELDVVACFALPLYSPQKSASFAPNFQLGAISDKISDGLEPILTIKQRAPEYFHHFPVKLNTSNRNNIIFDAKELAEIITTANSNEIYKAKVSLLTRYQVDFAKLIATVLKSLEVDFIQTEATSSNGVDLIDLKLDMAAYETYLDYLNQDTDQAAIETDTTNFDPAQILVNCFKEQSDAAQTPLDKLNGIKQHKLSNQFTYYELGNGPDVLLLVNAFGLNLNFWSRLVNQLAPNYRVIALDHEDRQLTPNRTASCYYQQSEYRDVYFSALNELIDSQNIEQINLVSWCGGVKLAVDYAANYSQNVANLVLLSPSFAGQAGDEYDSTFEKNLLTMCGIVDRSPSSAPTMAASMSKLMNQALEYDQFQGTAEDSSLLMSLPSQNMQNDIAQPFNSAENMIEYSRQLLNFREHDIHSCLSRLTQPVLLVCGSDDNSTSMERARLMCSEIARYRQFELIGGSHYLLEQNADIIAKLISNFIHKHPLPESYDSNPYHCVQEPELDMVSGEL